MTTMDKRGQWAQWLTALTSSPTGDDRTEKKKRFGGCFVPGPGPSDYNKKSLIFHGSKDQCGEVRYFINMAGIQVVLIKLAIQDIGQHRNLAKGTFMKKSCLPMFVYELSYVADGEVNDCMFL